MTTLQEQHAAKATPRVSPSRERRQYRRHDFEHQAITLERWDGVRGLRQAFGKIVDLSAGGVRVRTTARDGNVNILPDQQVRVRMELPAYAGICPFVDTSSEQPQPRREWTGWMAVARVTDLGDGEYEVAGRLVDMEEMDRGMLKLYLSTQPLAA
jgi:hypothetical protein